MQQRTCPRTAPSNGGLQFVESLDRSIKLRKIVPVEKEAGGAGSHGIEAPDDGGPFELTNQSVSDQIQVKPWNPPILANDKLFPKLSLDNFPGHNLGAHFPGRKIGTEDGNSQGRHESVLLDPLGHPLSPSDEFPIIKQILGLVTTPVKKQDFEKEAA
ncbi:hypothetical protein OJ253_2888 [Cryptosporidium canis]|uniref:Uncharacterized protein n=1 Tax=Cryptosporidium canis TaxID=195482 RepID=A0A9D5HWM4_9CRYT|nr:hypothetical protein OJ253_2888 [Cryptosporidium canis]